jgi:hypothetical protein
MTRRWPLIIVGIAVASLVALVAVWPLIAADISRTFYPERWWTPTPEVFDPETVADADAVRLTLGPAPAGHAWREQADWDGSIVWICLVNAAEPNGGLIDPGVAARRFASPPPLGYRWQAGKRPGGEWEDVCLRRTKCQYGQVRGRHMCERHVDDRTTGA